MAPMEGRNERAIPNGTDDWMTLSPSLGPRATVAEPMLSRGDQSLDRILMWKHNTSGSDML